MKNDQKMKLNIQLFNDGTTPEAGTPASPEVLNGTQPSSPEAPKPIYDFAGIKVSSEDTSVANAHNSYVHLQGEYNNLKNEIKELRSKQVEPPKQETTKTEQQIQKDARLDYLYNKAMSSDFETRKNMEYKNLENTLGEKFNEIKPLLDKAIDNMPLDKRMELNLNGLAKVALGEIMYSGLTKSPEQQLQTNQQMQQAAINDPAIRQQVIAGELNKYGNQEGLPPTMPNSGGAAPVAPSNGPTKSFREAGRKAKQARLDKQNVRQGLR